MNLPRRHHAATPRFYLDRWAGPDDQVCLMRLIRGDVKSRRYHPQNTGWISDLYRTHGVPEAQSQNFETQFLAPLDAKASLALAKLVTNQTLDIEERRQWTRFLLSQLFRTRETVTLIKSHMADICREAIIASEDEWARLRKPEEKRSLVEAMAGDRQLALSETRAEKMMRQIISEHRAEPDIMAMHWTCVDLRRSKTPLLTSDRPIVFLSLSEPDSYIALPLGPYHLFVAAFDDRFEKQFPTTDPSKVAWAMNRDVVSQAREFVWGLDDADIDFVRTYIGSAPDRVILSATQREEALAAARLGPVQGRRPLRPMAVVGTHFVIAPLAGVRARPRKLLAFLLAFFKIAQKYANKIRSMSL
jgi:hypothetical protein